MNPRGCLVFIATSSFLLAVGCGHALSNQISEPIQGAFFIRSKRDDARAMTMSGLFPNGGMSAFATSGDWGRWNRARGNQRPMSFPEQGWNNGYNNNNAQNIPQEEEETQFESAENTWKDQSNSPQTPSKEEQKPTINKKPKKKPNHHKDKSSEEDEDGEQVPPKSSGGNAAASFNAWFPIMLGMFPPSQDGVYGYTSSSRKSPLHTTVVANSVSHGPGGVASSHAVAYGGQPESRSQHH